MADSRAFSMDAVVNDSATTSSSQHTILQSVANSQESNYTSSSDRAITSPASDHSSRLGGSPDKADHLLQLSTIAAAQDRITTTLDDAARAGNYRKRMSDGEVKDLPSVSPVRGHTRNTSTVSVASTTGSTIGELSAELKTRLSYAMVKVNLGLQTRSIEEVECFAPGMSTAHRRHGSSASSGTATVAALDLQTQPYEGSDDRAFADKPTLAPPATIQPSLSTPGPRLHPRRNSSTPRHPALLHSQSASPHTPAHSMGALGGMSLSQGAGVANHHPLLFPPRTGPRNAREQDAVETLLFMSSPNNSANLKHTFSPSASPDPSQASIKNSGRSGLPGAAPRKGLPTHRPTVTQKKLDKSLGMMLHHPSDSPMDLASPQHSYYSPNRVTPRRRRGNSTHLRSALSLPTGLGGGHVPARRALRDEDIERMLDRVAAEAGDSSDDEEIQIPRLKNVASVMGVRS